MTDKKFCMSSYMAFRYIEAQDKEFYDGFHHENIKPVPDDRRIPVGTAAEIGEKIKAQYDAFSGKKFGVMLSGGMDSAIAASYLPKGSKAYTFRFLGGGFQKEELARAKYYADYYGLDLKYVDIDWRTVEKYIDTVMQAKAAPVHSIEPQIFAAALEAKADGVELMITGESSDLVFGGMDKLLAKEWGFDEFVKRYTFTDPKLVLEEPVDMTYLFERYRLPNEKIDYMKFMDDVFAIESSSSYFNAFGAAGLDYFDPYAALVMAQPLDLNRVRNGEPKYLIRELMSKRYPEIPVPDKNPMPRPVDVYFENWKGPERDEFRKDIDMGALSGNQKWQLWCLERFLNNNEG